MIDPLNCLALVGFIPHIKQLVVHYKQGPTVSLLGSSILVESICHMDTDIQTQVQ